MARWPSLSLRALYPQRSDRGTRRGGGGDAFLVLRSDCLHHPHAPIRGRVDTRWGHRLQRRRPAWDRMSGRAPRAGDGGKRRACHFLHEAGRHSGHRGVRQHRPQHLRPHRAGGGGRVGRVMKLYNYWRSSSSYRVRIALAYKGVAYEYVPVNIHPKASEQWSASFDVVNPLRQVPVLEIDAGPDRSPRLLTQSMAILEYLEEVFPAPALLPADPWQRARVRQLAEVVNSGIQPLQN